MLPNLVDRAVLHLKLCAALCFSGCAYVFVWLKLTHDHELSTPLLLFFPALSSLVCLFILHFVPTLTSVGRLRWPLMVTVPVVFGAILQLIAEFESRGSSPIIRLDFIGRECLFWQSLSHAGSLLVIQVATLTALALLGRPSKRSE